MSTTIKCNEREVVNIDSIIVSEEPMGDRVFLALESQSDDGQFKILATYLNVSQGLNLVKAISSTFESINNRIAVES